MIHFIPQLKTYLATIALTAFFCSASQTITGRVTADDGEPLIGATVLVKGTSRGTITDIDGNYQIEAASSDILVFAYLGFESQEVAVGNRESINVSLASSVTLMDEVVVVAYGTVRKSDLTGSVSSIKSDDLVSVPAASAVQALQGKVAGVRVVSNSGTPGEAPTVRIRGVGTFGDASPIYVVDGLILQDITFLNPADIESMEILKDASATSLYGSRGANGVIIVTTKSGKTGQQTTVDVSSEYGVQAITKYIDMLNARQFAVALNQIQPGTFNNLDLLEDTDWQREVYDPASIANGQVSVRGGSDKMGYYLALGYFKQNGIIEKSDFERTTIRINNYYEPIASVKLGHNLNFTSFLQNRTADVVASTLRAWPTDPAFDDNGEFFGNRGNGNPLASVEFTNNFRKGLRMVGNFYTEVSFLENFTFKTSYGLDYEYARSQNFTPIFFVTPQQQNTVTRLSKTQDRVENWLWENTLNFDKDFGEHKIDVLVGYTAQEDNSETLGAAGENLLRDFITFIPSNLENLTSVSNGAGIESRVSYLFRANYRAFNRYLITVSVRRDGSSRFSDANRWGNFPSLAVGWNVSEESFFSPLQSTFSYLKFRSSFGIVGNDKVGPLRRFTLVDNNTGAVFGVEETLNDGATFGTSGNPDLKWEEAEQLDIGLEGSIFNDRLEFEFDYYRKTTKGILVPLQLPATFGNGSFASTFFNAADVLNSGFEFDLSWQGNLRELNYSIGVNGATVNNEVLKIAEGTGNTEFISIGNLGNGQSVKRIEKGFPIGYFYGYKVAGIFQNDAELNQYPRIATQGVGDFRYVDVDGDGDITPDDRTFLGSQIPDLVFGLNLSAKYKGFDVAIDFQGELGKEIYNGKNAVRAGQYNYEASVLDAWNGDGSSNSEPRLTAAGVNYSQSDWFIQNGSYLRLRTITVGYQLPDRIIEKAYLKSARIYLRGTNLFTLTDYTGYTPEIGGDVDISVVDTGLYPVTAIYMGGVNLTF